MSGLNTGVYELQSFRTGTPEYDLLSNQYREKSHKLFKSSKWYYAFQAAVKLSFIEKWCINYLMKRRVLVDESNMLEKEFNSMTTQLDKFYDKYCKKEYYCRVELELTNLDQLLSRIVKVIDEKRARYNCNIDVVLVGRDEYEFIMGEDHSLTWIKPLELPSCQGFQCSGFRVILVPWMQGIVPIPDFSKSNF